MTGDNTDSDSRTAPETLTLDIPLDSPHSEMVRQLHEAGFDVASIVTSQIQPNAEQTVYNTFQSSKYDNGDDS